MGPETETLAHSICNGLQEGMTRYPAPAICPSVGLYNDYGPWDSPGTDSLYNRTSVQAEADRGRWVGEGSVPSQWGGICNSWHCLELQRHGDSSKQNFTAAAPDLSGTRDWFWGSQFSHRPGWGTIWGWFKCITFTVPFISIIVTSAPPQIIKLERRGWGPLL